MRVGPGIALAGVVVAENRRHPGGGHFLFLTHHSRILPGTSQVCLPGAVFSAVLAVLCVLGGSVFAPVCGGGGSWAGGAGVGGLFALGPALLALSLVGAFTGSWVLLIVGLVWGAAFLYLCRGSRHLVGLGSAE